MTPLTHLRGLLLLTPFTIHLFLANLLLSLLLPLSLPFPTPTYHLSSLIASSVWSHIQLLFTHLNHATILPSPSSSPLPAHESAIVIANHNAWSDFYLIQSLAQSSSMLGYCRWFAKSALKYVPLLGWGLWAMGMPLVSRNWMSDRVELERVFYGPVKRGWPVWLVSFVEGTRWTRGKCERGRAWARERGRRDVGANVLYPRTKGFVAMVRELRAARQVRAVYDFTIAYARREEGMGKGKEEWRFMGAPTIWETIARADLDTGFRFWVHVGRWELEDLPAEAEELESWLEERWVEKGERLQRLKVGIESGGDVSKLRL